MPKIDEQGSVELAETLRETEKHGGFIAKLLLGHAHFSSLFPFPRQAEEDTRSAAHFLEELEEILARMVDPNEIDRLGDIPPEVIQILKDMFAFGIKIPKEYDGLGFSQTNYCRIANRVGSWCANIAALLSAHNSLGATLPLMKYGTEEQKQRFLPRLAKGAISAFALTEPNVGSDPKSMETYAQRIYNADGSLARYELTGKKIYTTNAMTADNMKLAEVIVVVARIVDDPAEITDPKAKKCYGLFLVESEMEGYSVPERFRFSGLRSIYNGETRYERVRVPTGNIIGTANSDDGALTQKRAENGWRDREGDGMRIALQILTVGRLTIPALCTGGLKQALRMARKWGRDRVQWDKPIGEHQMMSKKIVDIAARAMALDAITQYCSLTVDNKEDVRIESAASKVIGTEYLCDAVNDLFQLRGGRAYETAACLARRGEMVMPVERMFRDSRINLIFEGSNEILRLWIAREGMDEYVKRGMTITNRNAALSAKAGSALWLLGKLAQSKLPALNGAPKYARFAHYFAFIKRQARQLANEVVSLSMRYKKNLEREQLILAGFVDHALALFEMAVVLSYTIAHSDKPLALELAEYFCETRMEKIYPPGLSGKRFMQWAKNGSRRHLYRLVKGIMAGEAEWLEDGIVPIPLEK